MEQPPAQPITPLQPRNSALAIWSLILGILSLTCFWIFSAIPAVICGHMAYGRIKRSDGALTGQGLALGGLITGYLSIAISLLIIPMMAAIAIPNFVKARTTAQMNVCIQHLHEIEAAKEQWVTDHKKQESDTPTMQELLPYLKTMPVCPAGGVYSPNAAGEKPTCSIPNHTLASE